MSDGPQHGTQQGREARGPVVVVLGPRGLALARRLVPHLPGAQVHVRSSRVGSGDATFHDVVAHLQSLFTAGRPIVAICAAGIVIRALTPVLADKTREPPVVAVAEDG
ncbi:MAG: hypothetical protein D6826_06525, partial [Alphaproteobacteria bacterium]